MKILSLHISSFGKLQNSDVDFSQNPRVFSQRNSFGKTTISAFIRAMLYGFKYTFQKLPDGTRETDAGHWAPWNGDGKFGGSMTVEQNGNIFRVERFFGAKASQETLSVFNEKSGEKVDLQGDVGEMFLGLTAESYDRSVCFPQDAIELTSNENFDARLAGLVQNTEDPRVLARLNEKKKQLKPARGSGGIIDELEHRSYDLQRELLRRKNALRRKADIENRLAQIAAEKQKAEAEQTKAGAEAVDLQNKIAFAKPTEEQRQKAEKKEILAKNLVGKKDFEKDYAALRDLAEKIEKTPEITKKQRGLLLPLLIIGIVLVVAGIGICFLNVVAGLSIVAAGIVCAVISFFAKPSLITLPSGEKDALISEYYSMAGKYINCADLDFPRVQQRIWEAYTAYIGDKREFEALSAMAVPTNSADVAALSQRLAEAKNAELRAQQLLRNLEREEGALVAECDALNTDCVSVADEIAETDKKIADAKKNFAVLTKVGELLEQAKQNLSVSYLPTLANRCSELLNNITDGQYRVVTDRNFVIRLRENGVTKPLENFSCGIREVTLFCFRVALSEMLFGGTIPLMIVDDSFVELDEENFARATSLLQYMSRNSQIIYFTCHNRLGALNRSEK